MFDLHPRLAADTLPVTELRLSRLLLMNDRTFPWLILVPRRNGVTELIDLAAEEQVQLMEEISNASRALREVARPDKLNIGMLGNLVPQLHVHVVGRFREDRAWPGPVWGSGAAVPYEAQAAGRFIGRIRASLGGEHAS
ncbi:MAG: HIT family protein [Alphaproteobacteria bacterium]|nr:HIT family protein [Alphaproteobacteria bacterium]